MELQTLDLTPDQRLSGQYDRGIIRHHCGLWSAWTKTWEGPGRPDRTAALADLRDRDDLESKRKR